MKLDALDHPKTFDLAARLGVELPTAIGHLELLWAFVGKQAPQGNIGKWPDGAIARACYWMGRPELFILALRKSGFLETDPAHRLTVHDWREHAPRWVKSKLKTLGLSFVDVSVGIADDISLDDEADTGGDIGGDTKGREGKTKEEKDAPARATPGLDVQAWTRWEAYRHALRKPIRPASAEAAMRALAAFGADQAAVVEQSVAQGWQGLFALKAAVLHVKPNGGLAPTPEETADRDRKVLENTARANGIDPAGLTAGQIDQLIFEHQNAQRKAHA